MQRKTDAMARGGLASIIKFKVILIVTVLMIGVLAYGQVLALRESKAEYAARLESITAFIATRLPAESFVNIAQRQGAGGKSPEAQAAAVTKEIQPILDNLLIPGGAIKYGVYSRFHQRFVAIGPDLDTSLLGNHGIEAFDEMYQTNQPRKGEKKNSFLWYGAPVIYHLQPVSHDGEVIGHVFAAANLNTVYSEFWRKAFSTLAGCFIALLLIIMLFQEMFIKLKNDLALFAESIITGNSRQFESTIPELMPVLNYIREQTENMARLDRLNVIGEMAASIGHEVRNPMTTVRGFLQFMSQKDEFAGSKEHFALMIDELDRANEIICEFLSLAKNKAMDFHDTDLNNIISEVAPLLQADAIRHNCQLQMDLAAIPPARLDESSIRQLILNLVRNAIEAMPQGGTVRISTAARKGKVALSIRDQGVGIPGEVLEKLGTPFVTTKESGIGLGLAVCYRIAQRHGAIIDVESEAGQGTSFVIAFPAAKKRN